MKIKQKSRAKFKTVSVTEEAHNMLLAIHERLKNEGKDYKKSDLWSEAVRLLEKAIL
jgi:hypothetical protein